MDNSRIFTLQQSVTKKKRKIRPDKFSRAPLDEKYIKEDEPNSRKERIKNEEKRS